MTLIDEYALNQFYHGDEELLVDMTNIFVEHLPAIVQRLRTAIANQDAAELHEVSHQFKSDLGYFFSHDLRAIACELEVRGREHKLDGCNELTEKLLAGLEGLLLELSLRTKSHFKITLRLEKEVI